MRIIKWMDGRTPQFMRKQNALNLGNMFFLIMEKEKETVNGELYIHTSTYGIELMGHRKGMDTHMHE